MLVRRRKNFIQWWRRRRRRWKRLGFSQCSRRGNRRFRQHRNVLVLVDFEFLDQGDRGIGISQHRRDSGSTVRDSRSGGRRLRFGNIRDRRLRPRGKRKRRWRRRRGTRLERRHCHFDRVARLQGRVRQHLGNPPQLADHGTDREDEKAADDGCRPRDNERIAEAEFLDRDAVTGHPQAQHGDNGPDNHQQN